MTIDTAETAGGLIVGHDGSTTNFNVTVEASVPK